VIVNPTWTPPPTIVEKDLFKNGSFNESAFTEHHLAAYDENNNPIEIDPSISLTELKKQRIKFTQPAGKQNPLGRLKFQLANSDDVYMHDTNSHGLFNIYNRNFSSGCIRIEKYMDLSSWILNEPKKKIEGLINKNQTIGLPTKKIPVKTVYWLAENVGEEVLFHSDIYSLSK
jgi:murein L,D-transpeptidase YcbB/YkuD